MFLLAWLREGAGGELPPGSFRVLSCGVPVPWGVSLHVREPTSEDLSASRFLGPVLLLARFGTVELFLECDPEGPHRLVDGVGVEGVFLRAEVQELARELLPRFGLLKERP